MSFAVNKFFCAFQDSYLKGFHVENMYSISPTKVISTISSYIFSSFSTPKTSQPIAAKVISGELKDDSQEKRILNQFLKWNPSFIKTWLDFPDEWKDVMLVNYHELRKSTTLEIDIHQYLAGAINRFNSLYNELALDTEYNVEALWLSIFQATGKATDASSIANDLLECVIAAKYPNRIELLKACIVSIKAELPKGAATAISLFSLLRKVQSSKSDLASFGMELLTKEKAELSRFVLSENKDDLENEIFPLDKNFGPLNVLQRLIETADRLITHSPRNLSAVIAILKSNYLAEFNNFCKIVPTIGLNASVQLIEQHFYKLRNSDILSFIKNKRLGNLKKVLEAEIKWKIAILPIFFESYCADLDYLALADLFTEGDRAFEYLDSEKIYQREFRSHLKLYKEELKLKENQEKLKAAHKKLS